MAWPQGFRCSDDISRLTYAKMYEQGIYVEFRKKIIENGEEKRVRYDEIKVAYGCRGLCDAIRMIPWINYTTSFDFLICQNFLLGLHGQIPGSIRDVVAEKFFDFVVRASDTMFESMRRPTEIKHLIKRFLPAGSSNLF